jgi:hypothetical protein
MCSSIGSCLRKTYPRRDDEGRPDDARKSIGRARDDGWRLDVVSSRRRPPPPPPATTTGGRRRFRRDDATAATALCARHSFAALRSPSMQRRRCGRDQADRADGVVVAGDDVVDEVGVAVRVGDGDDGDAELARLADRDRLLVRVDDEDRRAGAPPMAFRPPRYFSRRSRSFSRRETSFFRSCS